ncbi:MAG: ATP synthase F1 subunit gamma [Eubacteriales bacterium]|nr:ATP synthase F1 subunit gamma [Eubacteriales bacterium]
MASMRDIKRRRSSIQSTGQITRAMKLVATVKLQKAREKAEHTRPYSDGVYQTMQSILERSAGIRHPYLQGGGSGRKAVIVMTSNRGLAGGYNANVVKLITRGGLPLDQLDIYAAGKKGREALQRAGCHIRLDCSDMCEEPCYEDAAALGKEALASFARGEVGEIWLAYTSFVNTVVHQPKLIRLLPVSTEASGQEKTADSREETGSAAKLQMNYDTEEESILEMLIPKYIVSMIYGGLLEASASENGARMQAMDSATGNAEEMLEDLTLLYNRARQGAITQELTEIIGGAAAIG